MVTPVTIGDAASISRDIDPSEYAIGWRVTGPPGEAVSMDTWQVLLETRLRAILTSIITADAPTGITLQDFTIVAPMTLRMEYTVGGSAAHLDLDLTTLFTTDVPANVAAVAAAGSADGITHPDHGHRLPSRAQSETPIVGLDQFTNAPVAGRGKRFGFNCHNRRPGISGSVHGPPHIHLNTAGSGRHSSPGFSQRDFRRRACARDSVRLHWARSTGASPKCCRLRQGPGVRRYLWGAHGAGCWAGQLCRTD